MDKAAEEAFNELMEMDSESFMLELNQFMEKPSNITLGEEQ